MANSQIFRFNGGFVMSILMLLSIGCGTFINPRYVKLSKKNQEKLKPQFVDNVQEFYASYYNAGEKHEIYVLDSDGIKELIKEKEDSYSLIVFYAYWCGPCRSQMPKIDSLHRAYPDLLNVLYVSTGDWANLEMDRKYLQSQKVLAGASLGLDIYKYGTEYVHNPRKEKFILELGVEWDYFGFPTLILVDSNLNATHLQEGISDLKKIVRVINQ